MPISSKSFRNIFINAMMAFLCLTVYGIAQEIQLVGHLDLHSQDLMSIATSGNYAYLGSLTGMTIADISDPTHPDSVAYFNMGNDHWVQDIYLNGNYAYIANFEYGFKIIDISNPLSPTLVGADSSFGYCYGISARGNYLYLTSGDSLIIADITNPAHPELITRISYNGIADRQIFIVDSLAYIQGEGSFDIYGIRDVFHPRYISRTNVGNNIDWMALRDTVLYLTSSLDSGLIYYSVANPVHPCRLGRTGTNLSGGIAIFDTFLFVGYENGLKLFRITHSGQLLERARHNGYEEGALSILGDHIYGISQGGGMGVFDFPIIPCHYSPGNANGLLPFNSIDIMYDVNFLRGRGPAPPDSCSCPYLGIFYSSADANGNCEFNSLDITYSVNYLKGIGPAPVSCPDCPPR